MLFIYLFIIRVIYLFLIAAAVAAEERRTGVLPGREIPGHPPPTPIHPLHWQRRLYALTLTPPFPPHLAA